jgi:FkbM family methyltransferase
LRERLELVSLLLRSATGPRGFIRGLRVAAVRRGGPGPPEEPVGVPMRALGGDPLYVRPGSSDLVNAVSYYSTKAYLPPPEIDRPEIAAICELGTNIGAALAALGTRYPRARLIGLEADPENAKVAQRNLARFGDRATVVQSAVWSDETDLVIDRTSEHGEHGFLVRPRRPDESAVGSLRAITVERLLDDAAPGQPIDYMHVTIEGSEPQVLGAGSGWADRVRSLRVELHPYFGFGADECIAQLAALGYEAWVAPTPPDKWVFAVRE